MASAQSIDDGCRLCLNPFVESHSTIENPMLKEQMKLVFSFPVEFTNGLSSSVCETCTYTITEFYRYSLTVSENQKVLKAEHSNFKTESAWERQFETESSYSCEPSSKMSSNNPIFEVAMDIQVKQEEFIAEPPNKKDVGTQTGDDSCETPKPDVPVYKEDATDIYLKQHFALTCDLCNADVEHFAQLSYHFKSFHRRKMAYVKCCGKVFYERSLIIDHLRRQSHHTCTQCKKHFKYKAALKAHQMKVHCIDQPPQNTLISDQSKRPFSTETDLSLHIDEMHKHSGERKCKICNHWVHLQFYQRHMDEVHITEVKKRSLHKCKRCTRVFKRYSCLEAHIKSYHHECPRCHKHFDVLLCLTKHLATEHNVGFFCDYCNKYFTSKTPYELHVTVHQGVEAPQVLGL